MILLAAMLVTPVFAFIHPPPPPPPPVVPCETFAVKIEGEWCYDWAHAVEFHEPEDNFCDTFTVQVLALNVTDLYGFEYKLHWSSTYFALEEIAIEQVWADQLIVLNQTDSTWHKLVMVAKAPSPGVNDPNGGILLCTYTFHIVNDVCWPQGMVEGAFWIDEMEMSDSCTQDLDPCDPINAYWKFFPAEPEVYIQLSEDPDDTHGINCVVGEEITYQVWVHNITKMKSFHFKITWMGNHIVNCRENLWLQILNLEEVVINEDVFPEANRTDSINIHNANKTSWVVVDIVMDCTYPLINGTFKAVDLIFKKMDPWWCGRQPEYDINLETHEMRPDNATTKLDFAYGWIDVMCPELAYIYFGDVPEVEEYWHVTANLQDTNVFNDVNADVWKITRKDEVEFIVNILDLNIPHPGQYGMGVVISTSPTPTNDTCFQVCYREDLDNLWHYVSYGTGWGTGVDVTEPNLPAGIIGLRSGRWFYVTIPISYLGGSCSTYYWATQFRTNLLGTFPEGIDVWAGGYGYVYPAGFIVDNFEEEKTMCLASDSNCRVDFTFMPVPGDLTGDGLVDIKDLTAIAAKYCLTWTCTSPSNLEKWKERYYYDFNKDGHIDIFDIIVVSKNWERSCPF